MSDQDDRIVISDLPCHLVVTIITDYGKSPAKPEIPTNTFQTRSPTETVLDVAHRIEETLKHSKPIESVRGATSRIEEIFNRAKPIEFAAEEPRSYLVKDEHETRVVRHRVQDGDCLPEQLAHQKPFHIYHNEDGSLELYWLINSRLQRVG